MHGREKHTWKERGGRNIRTYGKRKGRCQDCQCGGSDIRTHAGREKHTRKEQTPAEQTARGAAQQASAIIAATQICEAGALAQPQAAGPLEVRLDRDNEQVLQTNLRLTFEAAAPTQGALPAEDWNCSP